MSAPASLLVCGEYFVTEHGGEGLCMAVEPRARCYIEFDEARAAGGDKKNADKNLTPKTILLTCAGGTEMRFDNARDNALFCAAEDCAALYNILYAPLPAAQNTRANFSAAAATISVDTNAFYEGEKKLGFGSSESAALLLCAAIALREGRDPLSNLQALAAHAAYAHFLWQGKKGSGYGAFASAFGGVGLYKNLHTNTAGSEPENANRGAPPFFANQWNAMDSSLYDAVPWYFWKSPKSVSSPSALQCYRAWKAAHPRAAQNFARANETLFAALRGEFFGARAPHNGMPGAAATVRAWREAIETSKAIGLALGKKIGVSARITLPAEPNKNERARHKKNNAAIYKASGAGAECALALTFGEELPMLRRLAIAPPPGIRYDA